LVIRHFDPTCGRETSSGWSMAGNPLSFPESGAALTLERLIRNG
jgi:hypothetical protein